MKKFIVRLCLLLGITGIIIGLFIPLMKAISYGPDLKGGFEILYKVSSLDGSKVTNDMVTATYKTMSRRIDGLGISEPIINIEGTNRIRITLAGVTNKEEATKVLSKAASLSFRDTSDNLLMTAAVLNAGKAKVTTNSKGTPAVSLSISDKDLFYKVTNKIKNMADNRIVIWLDFEEGVDSYATSASTCGSLSTSNCLSAATVSQAFASDVIIEGSFTSEEVTTLVELINSGSLPTKLSELSSSSVNATFGENSLNKTFIAGIVGIAIIFAMMISIYHFGGIIASVGLTIYAFLLFFIFWLFGGVLTLPGIASFLLGIGMAVDANVLSFERIKEELYKGHSLKESFVEGYKNSLSSIIDGNMTTLIVAIVLFFLGESSVKGFATVLIISICVTILVMVFITRWLLNVFIKTKYFDKKPELFLNVKTKDIPTGKDKNFVKKESLFRFVNFLKPRKLYFIFSSIILVIGIISTFVFGLNLSVDFKGGTDFTIMTTTKVSDKTIKADFIKLGYSNVDVSNIGNNAIYVKMTDTLNKNSISNINKHFVDSYKATVENGSVSTTVKQELVKNAFLSLIFAFLGIIAYVSIRFTFHFALSAIFALLHDTLIVVALFSIFHFEVDTIFIAAILTIIGYSINDTVVIFDRIREEAKNNKKESTADIINKSLGITMTRSLYTVITTLIPIICLLIFGAHGIFNFTIAMFFGVMSGCYSSLCIASPLWYEMIKNRKVALEKTKVIVKDKVEEMTIKGINS